MPIAVFLHVTIIIYARYNQIRFELFIFESVYKVISQVWQIVFVICVYTIYTCIHSYIDK